jgi:hypothetical protein
MKAQDSMIVTNKKMTPGAENVSSRVAYSIHANTAPTLAVALIQHQDGETAFILSQRLPVNLRHVAVGNHPKGEDEIEGNADVPTGQNARHAAKLL